MQWMAYPAIPTPSNARSMKVSEAQGKDHREAINGQTDEEGMTVEERRSQLIRKRNRLSQTD